MISFELAIDDYLHTIVRSRPWIKKREEALLSGLCDWLYEQPTHSGELAAVGPDDVARYVAEQGLSDEEQVALHDALDNLHVWAAHHALVEANPFARTTAA